MKNNLQTLKWDLVCNSVIQAKPLGPSDFITAHE